MQKLSEYWLSIREKMVKDPLPVKSVAAGWAIGVFIGCTIPFGFQLVISVPLAILMRVSKIGATVGTLVTNPVTIWVIYPAQTYLVNKVVFGGSLSFSRLMEMEWTWQSVRELGVEVVASFFIGGFVLGAILTPLAYIFVYRLVSAYRARKACVRAGTSARCAKSRLQIRPPLSLP